MRKKGAALALVLLVSAVLCAFPNVEAQERAVQIARSGIDGEEETDEQEEETEEDTEEHDDGAEWMESDEEEEIKTEPDLTISSAQDLYMFAQDVQNGNSYEGKLVRLTDDIDLDREEKRNFMPIGLGGRFLFSGTFDGDGHAIRGIREEGSEFVGLFHGVTESATVKNITIEDAVFYGYYAGGIVCHNFGMIKNCHVRASEIRGGSEAGGVCAYNEGKIVNCSVNAVISAGSEFPANEIGGIVGCNEEDGEILNSCIIGSVEIIEEDSERFGFGRYAIGGITGTNAGRVQNCYQAGMIAQHERSVVGAIAGRVYTGSITNCFHTQDGRRAAGDMIEGTLENNNYISEEDMQSESFLEDLNAGRSGHFGWLTWEFRDDLEYPQLKRLTDLSVCTASLEKKDFVYTGEEITPAVSVFCGKRRLTEDVDYRALYQNHTDAGTAQVILAGIGEYKGCLTRSFEIRKGRQEILCSAYYKKNYGEEDFSLNVDLTEEDGTIGYSSSDSKVAQVDGRGVVKICGTGRTVLTVAAAETQNYGKVSKRITIDVCPRKQSVRIKRLKNRKWKIIWKKDGRADGYQVQYGRGKKLAGKTRCKTINKKTSVVLKKLKKRKAYYVRVRSFRNIWENGKKKRLYGSWSWIRKMKKV